MNNRLHKLNERTEANHNLLTWFGIAAAGAVIAAIAFTNSANAAEPNGEEGLMLRPGSWAQDAEGYVLPVALDTNPRNWPTSGWYRVTNKDAAVQVQAVATPERGMPDFLREIAVQVVDPTVSATRGEAEAEAIDTRYIRLPGVTLAEGRVPTVKFSRGVLTPKLDHTYELMMGQDTMNPVPFTLTVQNGLRNKAGVAYGDGAVYTVTSGGETWSFHVPGGHGWETTIQFAADLDGDRKPDFIVQVGDQETLLMSSRAKPGLNPPAASLVTMAGGC